MVLGGRTNDQWTAGLESEYIVGGGGKTVGGFGAGVDGWEEEGEMCRVSC